LLKQPTGLHVSLVTGRHAIPTERDRMRTVTDLAHVAGDGRPAFDRIRGPPFFEQPQTLNSLRISQPLFKEEQMSSFYRTESIELLHGDSMPLLTTLKPNSFDAIITDPPYCSGGTTAGERRRAPEEKYAQNGNACGRPSFGGDLKDQRSFTWWCMSWLSLCRGLLHEGGYCLVFTDWRQLPAVTDAFQAADLTWRGIIAWDKGNAARAPHKGYLRHQCEYVVWGTRGPCPAATHAGPFPGCYSIPVNRRDKHHLTGKPTDLMRQLVQIVRPGGRILDPFAGSGTTLVAAQAEGLQAVGIEREASYCEITKSRLRTKPTQDPHSRILTA
jgi:site-specific DNA-methyltransferase (adenine-specific)